MAMSMGFDTPKRRNTSDSSSRLIVSYAVWTKGFFSLTRFLAVGGTKSRTYTPDVTVGAEVGLDILQEHFTCVGYEYDRLEVVSVGAVVCLWTTLIVAYIHCCRDSPVRHTLKRIPW